MSTNKRDRLTTEKQRQAARKNGSKSKGPATTQGKERASLNARGHQLTAAALVLSSEEETEFDQLLQSYFREFRPAGEIETSLVEQMVAAKWRERRCWVFQKSIVDVRMTEELDQDYDDIQKIERGALAFAHEAENTQALQLLQRYETMHTRTWRRAWRDLLDCQKAKLRNEPDKHLTLLKPASSELETEPINKLDAA